MHDLNSDKKINNSVRFLVINVLCVWGVRVGVDVGGCGCGCFVCGGGICFFFSNLLFFAYFSECHSSYLAVHSVTSEAVYV